jgi:hypothetical protein
MGSASGRRLDTVIAEILPQLRDPPLNEGSGVVRPGIYIGLPSRPNRKTASLASALVSPNIRSTAAKSRCGAKPIDCDHEARSRISLRA